MQKKIRLGTRGSKLALAQAEIVKSKLINYDPNLICEIIIIQTSGDIDLISPLHEIGGKGVFIKEIEQALLDNRIDIAIHSLKDITSNIPPKLELSGFLEAEASADVLLMDQKYSHFEEIPIGSTIATGSMRRRALLKKLRPDLNCIEIRGNVMTRIEKLSNKAFDGLMLSEAGLIRLGLENLISYRFNPTLFCPAPGQGVIALQTRKEDHVSHTLCREINHKGQELKSTTELLFLEKIGFDCRSPLGLHAQFTADNTLTFLAFLSNQKMDQFLEERITFSIDKRIDPILELSARFIAWKEKYD